METVTGHGEGASPGDGLRCTPIQKRRQPGGGLGEKLPARTEMQSPEAGLSLLGSRMEGEWEWSVLRGHAWGQLQTRGVRGNSADR